MVSPFVNNTPVVVILMPIVLAFCRDHNIAASQLLIPLSYATILGGTCSVVGTSTHVVVLLSLIHIYVSPGPCRLLDKGRRKELLKSGKPFSWRLDCRAAARIRCV